MWTLILTFVWTSGVYTPTSHIIVDGISSRNRCQEIASLHITKINKASEMLASNPSAVVTCIQK